MDTSLHGRTALVTGSYRGTGAAIAKQLHEEGARTILHEFERGQAQQLADELGTVDVVCADISSEEGCAELLQQIQALGADVDVLVNNYGTAAGGTWQSASSDAWLDMYQRNVLSAARLCRAFLPDMQDRRWGRIINLGTIGSSRPNARMPHYYAAKGALAAMTMSLVREAGANGVTINLVSPGLILTDEVRSYWLDRGNRNGWGTTWEEIEPHVAAEIPLGRIARREEVADLVSFLASDRAACIHGQNIAVDGGALGLVN